MYYKSFLYDSKYQILENIYFSWGRIDIYLQEIYYSKEFILIKTFVGSIPGRNLDGGKS